MVAEPRIHSAVEKIVRWWLQHSQSRQVGYGYSEKYVQPFFVLRHVAGLDDAATIQFDIWGKDKESTLDQLNILLNLLDSVSSYNTPYGVLMAASPLTYTWQPDESQSRYICDATVVCYTTV